MIKRLFLLSVMIGLALGWQVKSVTAQETSVSDSAQQAVLQKQSLDDEITQLEVIYRGQLTEYRAAEKEFQIAKDQYQKLQTLASINAATDSAKKVMKLRAQVLDTYFELLRVNLIAADGIEVSLKQTVVNRLVDQKGWLEAHQTTLANTTDREQFNQLADTFTAKKDGFTEVSQEAVSLLSVGKLQNVFDRLNLLTQDLATQEASNSAVTEASAMRETNRLIDTLGTGLKKTWSDVTTAVQKSEIDNFYSNLAQTLDPIYANLNKLVSFLDELLRTL